MFFYLWNSPLKPLTSLVSTSDVGHFDDSLLAIHCTKAWTAKNRMEEIVVFRREAVWLHTTSLVRHVLFECLYQGSKVVDHVYVW